MPTDATRVHLLIPGLLDPFPGLPDVGQAPKTSLLDTLLSKADDAEYPVSGFEETLFHLLGIASSDNRDLPTAAFSRLGQDGEPGDGCWFHAAPVYLKPDMDRLIVFDARSLDIRPDEADSLVRLIESHFAEEQWRLEVSTPEHWYLRLPQEPAVTTSPLHDVVGRSLFPFLPTGDEATRWRGLLNEIQMLLYHAEVNEIRRDDGRPEINGLWLWGGGDLPDVRKANWQCVYTKSDLLKGMARRAGIVLSASTTSRFPTGDSLVCLDALINPVREEDGAGRLTALEELGPSVEPVFRSLSQKTIDHLLVYPCNGQVFELTASSLRRFWRRRKPVLGRCST